MWIMACVLVTTLEDVTRISRKSNGAGDSLLATRDSDLTNHERASLREDLQRFKQQVVAKTEQVEGEPHKVDCVGWLCHPREELSTLT